MASHSLYPCMILLLLSITSCFADPNIVSSPETVEVYSGETAVLRCQVQDLGRSTVSWSSVSQNFVIYEGKQLMTNDVIKYSLINVPEGSVFNLQILSVEKSDQGFYKCAIDGTNKEIITHLDVLDKPNFAIAQGPPLNFTDCCLAENVSPSCLPACYPDQIDLDSFDALVNCGSEGSLAGLAKCFTAGSNHDNCCLSSGVPPLCIAFCHNEIPDTLTTEHLTQCYQHNVINGIFDCFEMGFEHLPSEPTEVGGLAMHDGIRASILMKWSPPSKNPDKVTGYKIMYKSRNQQNYMSVLIHNPLTHQYRLTADKDKIVANMDYFIYISALAEHGVSFGSVEVDVFVPDPSFQETINADIDACCADRNVNDKCRDTLCRSKTWAQFSTNDTLQCFPYLDSIFTCLVGQRNHTNCCAAYDVTSDCLPLCSGQRPTFDSSLIGCVSQMNIIEGCIQEGYDAMPAPPSQLTLEKVETTTAIFVFQPSSSQGIIRYLAEVGTGESKTPDHSISVLGTNSYSFTVTNLEPDTYYWVRLISETDTAGSLPSEKVAFLTYPESYLEPTPPPVTNVPHNLTGCCIDSGMPELCWQGCEYRPNITAYFKPMEVLQVCYAHIGTVLACAADGRDHTDCCKAENMLPVCVDLCAHTKKGPLDPQYIACVGDTAKAVKCYMEGILDLPRHPDVYVASVSKNSITLQWEQPKTSGRIDLYIIEYSMQGMTNKTSATTNKNSYIMQNLQPGKAYEITVSSQNENGTSVPSPMIQAYTAADMTVILPALNITDTTGRAFWQNITHCCENSVSEACQEQCLNKQQTISSQSLECADESHKMLACFADGQDHRLCCEQKQVPAICLPVCSGHALDIDISMATCMSYAHRDAILSCFLENDGLIPGAPPNFIVKTATEGAVQMSWSSSLYCSADCTYTVSYWKEGQFTQSKSVTNATSPFTLDGLETDQRYTFTVWAKNHYGSSPPAPWQTLFVTAYKRDVKVLLRGDNQLVDISTTAVLECETTGFDPDDNVLQIVWYFNNKRELQSGSKILRIDSVDPQKDEGLYTCTVTDSTLSSSDTLFLPIKYAPKFDQLRDESAVPGMGNQMKVACWFWGFPDSEPEDWHKDGVLIRRDLSKYSMNIDQRYHTGITSYRIKIANVEESDYGVYSIKVSNKYGQAECHVKMDHPDNMTEVIAPVKPSNPLQCCRDKNVSELCQELCGFDIDISAIVSDLNYISCLTYFEDFITCGADGRDHSKCCTEEGVLPFCIPFCSGIVPGDVFNDAEEMLQCVSETPAIFGCAEKGATQLPFAPENVILSPSSSGASILVRWSKPYYSQDKIDHFNIYYNYTGHSNTETRAVNVHITQFEIVDVKPVTTYYIWMTSGNKFGNSQPTVIKQITTPSFATESPPPQDSPYDLKATPIENSAVVRLTWEMVNGDMYSGYKIYYKELNAVRYESIQIGRTRSYHFENLQAQTTYQAYIVAISSTGNNEETKPSDPIQFTTGVDDGSTARQQDSDDNSRKVAIGVGVTVAIIALIAIVFLVIFFVYRARVFKPRMNDSVAFENPGFGNPGQIKIHGVDDQYGYGRLEEDGVPRTNVYDNAAAGESSTDPAYENSVYSTAQPSDISGAATLPVDTKS